MTEETLHLPPSVGVANIELLKILDTYRNELLFQNGHYAIAHRIAALLDEFGIRCNALYSIGQCISKIGLGPLLD